MIAEALPLSKQTLGLALHAAGGVLLAILLCETLRKRWAEQELFAHLCRGY
jgi:hypothetical protein